MKKNRGINILSTFFVLTLIAFNNVAIFAPSAEKKYLNEPYEISVRSYSDSDGLDLGKAD